MTRPALIVAVLLVLVLLPGVIAAWLDPGDTATYELGAAPTSQDRLPYGFERLVAAIHDRTPPTMPPTTQPERRPRQGSAVVGAAAAAGVNSTTGQVNGYPCGGDLPPCRVLACESGGNPTAENPTSSASGLWQILDGTWAGYGGYQRALHAPADIQNAKAAALWAGGDGAFHWSSCL